MRAARLVPEDLVMQPGEDGTHARARLALGTTPSLGPLALRGGSLRLQ
jgi:hypothetical protein